MGRGVPGAACREATRCCSLNFSGAASICPHWRPREPRRPRPEKLDRTRTVRSGEHLRLPFPRLACAVSAPGRWCESVGLVGIRVPQGLGHPDDLPALRAHPRGHLVEVLREVPYLLMALWASKEYRVSSHLVGPTNRNCWAGEVPRSRRPGGSRTPATCRGRGT